MTRQETITKDLRYWQIFLNLQSWELKIRLVDFTRTDWPQSGDIEVDTKKKKATVLLTKNDTGKDKAIILHELLHLVLWQYDHFVEDFIPKEQKKEYFTLLEKVVADLQIVILQEDK